MVMMQRNGATVLSVVVVVVALLAIVAVSAVAGRSRHKSITLLNNAPASCILVVAKGERSAFVEGGVQVVDADGQITFHPTNAECLAHSKRMDVEKRSKTNITGSGFKSAWNQAIGFFSQYNAPGVDFQLALVNSTFTVPPPPVDYGQAISWWIKLDAVSNDPNDNMWSFLVCEYFEGAYEVVLGSYNTYTGRWLQSEPLDASHGVVPEARVNLIMGVNNLPPHSDCTLVAQVQSNKIEMAFSMTSEIGVWQYFMVGMSAFYEPNPAIELPCEWFPSGPNGIFEVRSIFLDFNGRQQKPEWRGENVHYWNNTACGSQIFTGSSWVVLAYNPTSN